jgi:predicted Zn-dependent protease
MMVDVVADPSREDGRAMAERGRSLLERSRLGMAEFWLRRALHEGHEPAAVMLYHLFEIQDRQTELRQWRRRAAEAGSTRALAAEIGEKVSIDRLGEIRLWLANKPPERRRLGRAITAQTLHRLGRMDEAETWAHQLATEEKAHSEILVALLMKQGRAADMIDWIGQLTRETLHGPRLPMCEPFDDWVPAARFLNMAIWYLIDHGQATAAELQLREIVWKTKDPYEVWGLYVELLLAAGKANDAGEADEILRPYVERGDSHVFGLLLRLMTAQERVVELEHWLRAKIDAADADLQPRLRCMLADVLLQENRPVEAEDLLQPDARKWPERPWPQLGRALAMQGDILNAILWLRRAHSWQDLFQILTTNRMAPEAERIFRAEVDQGRSECRIYLAQTLVHLGSPDEAELLLYRAAAKGSQRDRGYLISFLTAQGRSDEADYWRRTNEYDESAAHWVTAGGTDFATVVLTAVVTTAVAPFIQTLVTEIAKDGYQGMKALIRHTVRRAKGITDKDTEPDKRQYLLIVQDPRTPLRVLLQSDLPAEAAHALAEVDLDRPSDATEEERPALLVWDPDSRIWRATQ